MKYMLMAAGICLLALICLAIYTRHSRKENTKGASTVCDFSDDDEPASDEVLKDCADNRYMQFVEDNREDPAE